MGIDDESSHPAVCSEVADGVTRNIVCLFREPDAVNLPVRFDEREQETEPSQTGLRWRDESQVKYPPGDPNPYYSWRANPSKASSADIHGHGKFAVVVGPIASSTYNLRS